MKTQLVIAFSCLLCSSFFSTAQISNALKKVGGDKLSIEKPNGVGQDEIAAGLKEALTRGVEKGVEKITKPDGFYKDLEIKLLMPEEAQMVEEKMRKIGQGQKVDDAIESMNRAAEDASVKAKDIFVGAIKQMSLSDAKSILDGSDNAATTFLEKSTRAQLYQEFSPIVKASLDKVGATKYWETLFNAYNKIPMVQKVNTDLVEYTTNKAIDGLFIQIAKEELEIRNNPGARVSELLQKVFG